MKKQLFTLLAVAAATTAMAAPIGQKQAAQRAMRVMNAQTGANTSVRQVEIAGMDRHPAYYVFNNTSGQGYVLVSGDDRMPEVIAYSPTGQWPADESLLPPALLSVLDNYSQKTADIRLGLMPAPAYKAPAEANYHDYVVAPLLSTSWSQAYPYNMQAPSLEAGDSFSDSYMQRYPIGCGAVALAQIMNYWQYPQHPVQRNYAYTVNKKSGVRTVSAATTYDYANIPDQIQPTPELSGLSQEEWERQAEAVGTFLGDVAYAMNMSWDKTGGGSSSVIGLQTTILGFDYSYDTNLFMTSGTGQLSLYWDLIQDDLDNARPVFTGGQDEVAGGGHGFVIDGYDEGGFVHVNWGWGGHCNELHVDPNILGTNKFDERQEGDYQFNSSNVILYNLHPRQEGEELDVFNYYGTMSSYLILNGMRGAGDIATGMCGIEEPIAIYAAALNLMGSLGMSYDTELCLYNTDTREPVVYGEDTIRFVNNEEAFEYLLQENMGYEVTLDSSLPDGLYSLGCAYRLLYGDQKGAWESAAGEEPYVVKSGRHLINDTLAYNDCHFAPNCWHVSDPFTGSYADAHMLRPYELPAEGFQVGDTVVGYVALHLNLCEGFQFPEDFDPESTVPYYVEVTKDGETVESDFFDDRYYNLIDYYYDIAEGWVGNEEFCTYIPYAFIPAEPGTYQVSFLYNMFGQVVRNEIVVGGDITGMSDLQASASAPSALYNAYGQRVGKDYRGMTISHGRKQLCR